jgi:hypothetical protein
VSAGSIVFTPSQNFDENIYIYNQIGLFENKKMEWPVPALSNGLNGQHVDPMFVHFSPLEKAGIRK